jgi:hypothetical protein
MHVKGGRYFNMRFAVRIIGLKYHHFSTIKERSRKLDNFLKLTIALEIDR